MLKLSFFKRQHCVKINLQCFWKMRLAFLCCDRTNGQTFHKNGHLFSAFFSFAVLLSTVQAHTCCILQLQFILPTDEMKLFTAWILQAFPHMLQ